MPKSKTAKVARTRRKNRASPLVAAGIQRRIADARKHLEVAENELETALNALKVSERANKVMISNVLQLAFSKLAAAKTRLDEVLGEK